MTMRLLVVLLVVANLIYFTWTLGGLAMFGTEPARFSETEPQRLSQQVRPKMLEIKVDNGAAKP
jgi:hypothetical protein